MKRRRFCISVCLVILSILSRKRAYFAQSSKSYEILLELVAFVVGLLLLLLLLLLVVGL